MATIATCNQPYPDLVSVPSTPATLNNRFPVAPMALGFCTDMDLELEPLAVEPPYYLMGVLQPESGYLEPTLGQIWPRIG